MTTYEWSDWRNTDMVWIQVRMPLVYFPCPDPSTILLHTLFPPAHPTHSYVHTRGEIFEFVTNLEGDVGWKTERVCQAGIPSAGRVSAAVPVRGASVFGGVFHTPFSSPLCARGK